MKKKQLISLILALLMVFATACTTQQTDTEATATTPDTSASADTADTGEVDDSTVIAQIGSTRTVTYGELREYYEYYLEMLSYYGADTPTDEEEIEELQDMLLEDLVEQAKLFYFAEQFGLTELTAEEQAEVEANAAEEMESYMEDFRATAEEEGAEDVETRARELFDQDLADYGLDMDSYEYEEYLVTLYAEDLYLEKLENYIRDGAVATEEDAQAYYDELVTEQSADYGESPSLYGDDAEYYDRYGGIPCVVIPGDYVRVKVIAILPDGEIDSEYTEKVAKMAEYEAEYGNLALNDATGNAARLKDLSVLYAALKIETEAMHTAYFAAAKEKAAEAYDALLAGASFDDVLKEYGEDADYENFPNLMENGRPLYLKGTDDGEKELREAASGLSVGEYSGIIETDSALYILYIVKEETAGTVAFEDVKEAMLVAAQEEAGDAAWDDQQLAWDEDDSMVTLYPELYRSLGK